MGTARYYSENSMAGGEPARSVCVPLQVATFSKRTLSKETQGVCAPYPEVGLEGSLEGSTFN